MTIVDAQLSDEDAAAVQDPFTERDLRTIEVVQMTNPELHDYISFHIDRLRSIGWPYHHQRLREVGLDAMPYLIAKLDSDADTASEFRGRHGPNQNTEQPFREHGELAWYVLKDLVDHFSDMRMLKPGVTAPNRDKVVWQAWYKRHGRRLAIYGRDAN